MINFSLSNSIHQKCSKVEALFSSESNNPRMVLQKEEPSYGLDRLEIRKPLGFWPCEAQRPRSFRDAGRAQELKAGSLRSRRLRALSPIGAEGRYRVASKRNHARRSASSIQTSIKLVVA
jgi:hypothetical protein